jgi:RNAse (barnase) inhibitor barstar
MNLMDPTTPAVMVVTIDPVSVDAFGYRLEAQQPGTQVRRVQGRRSRNWPDLSDELAAALQLPSYYGGNWAALEDCLRDLRVPTVLNYVILVAESAQLLTEGPASALETFLGIIANVDFEWQEDASQAPPPRLRLFLAEAPQSVGQLASRLAALTIEVGQYQP